MKHDDKYLWLDLARGISALVVCAGHLRFALFVDHYSETNNTFFDNMFYFLTGLGHQAVMIFFVLSGFFVGGSVISRRNNFKFKEYILNRLTRLWIVLLPALLVTGLVDHILSIYHLDVIEGEHRGLISSGPKENGYSNSIITLAANVFFLQTVYAPVYGSNGPLWSLSNEFWYYLIFPLMMLFSSAIYDIRLRLIAAVLLIVIFLTTARDMMLGLVIWLLGAYAFYLKNEMHINFKIPVAIALILFVLALVDSQEMYMYDALGISSDLIVGVCFFFVLVSNWDKEGLIASRSIASIAKSLSEISYSLYLFHFPFVLLVYSQFYKSNQLITNGIGYLHYTFWLVLLVGIAYVAWWLFERNTNGVRIFLKDKLLSKN
ncbi:MAG: acyltransferase [Pseudomonadales bacterium]|nr:acyltransferase [Pseudomonadales bacterium]